MNNAANVHEFVAQRWSIGKTMHLSNFAAIGESAKPSIEYAVDRIVIGFRAWCLAEVHEAKIAEVAHFATWWDHFKDAKFPLWLLARFPAKRVTVTVFEPITVRVCPHIHIPADKNNTEIHMAYLNPNTPWTPDDRP